MEPLDEAPETPVYFAHLFERFQKGHRATAEDPPRQSASLPEAALALQQLLREGGFTLNQDLQGVPLSQYFVAQSGKERAMPLPKVTPEVIEQQRRRIMRTHPDALLGAWNDNGVVYFDASHAFQERHQAEQFAKGHRQRAIFDGENGRVLAFDGQKFAGQEFPQRLCPEGDYCTPDPYDNDPYRLWARCTKCGREVPGYVGEERLRSEQPGQPAPAAPEDPAASFYKWWVNHEGDLNIWPTGEYEGEYGNLFGSAKTDPDYRAQSGSPHHYDVLQDAYENEWPYDKDDHMHPDYEDIRMSPEEHDWTFGVAQHDPASNTYTIGPSMLVRRGWGDDPYRVDSPAMRTVQQWLEQNHPGSTLGEQGSWENWTSSTKPATLKRANPWDSQQWDEKAQQWNDAVRRVQEALKKQKEQNMAKPNFYDEWWPESDADSENLQNDLSGWMEQIKNKPMEWDDDDWAQQPLPDFNKKFRAPQAPSMDIYAGSSKPLLLVDVDGVLAPFMTRADADNGNMVPHDFEWDPNLKVYVSPQIEKRMRVLGEHFNLVWATAWEHGANRFIAPHYGMPEMPVISFSNSMVGGSPWDITNPDIPMGFWKTPALAEFGNEHPQPIAYIDDDADMWDVQEWAKVRSDRVAPTLALGITYHQGLTDADVNVLVNWSRSLGYDEGGEHTSAFMAEADWNDMDGEGWSSEDYQEYDRFDQWPYFVLRDGLGGEHVIIGDHQGKYHEDTANDQVVPWMANNPFWADMTQGRVDPAGAAYEAADDYGVIDPTGDIQSYVGGFQGNPDREQAIRDAWRKSDAGHLSRVYGGPGPIPATRPVELLNDPTRVPWIATRDGHLHVGQPGTHHYQLMMDVGLDPATPLDARGLIDSAYNDATVTPLAFDHASDDQRGWYAQHALDLWRQQNGRAGSQWEDFVEPVQRKEKTKDEQVYKFVFDPSTARMNIDGPYRLEGRGPSHQQLMDELDPEQKVPVREQVRGILDARTGWLRLMGGADYRARNDAVEALKKWEVSHGIEYPAEMKSYSWKQHELAT